METMFKPINQTGCYSKLHCPVSLQSLDRQHCQSKESDPACRNRGMASGSAGDLLEPVLSQVKRQQSLQETTRVLLDSDSSAPQNSFNSTTKDHHPTFRATAQAIQALSHPLHMPRYKVRPRICDDYKRA